MLYLNPDATQALGLAVGCTHHDRAPLNRLIDQPNISIGDQTDANDFAPPQDWAAHLAPCLGPGAGGRLVALAWWDQPPGRSCAALPALIGADLAAPVAAFAP
ncbi:MAG: hypothetical protein ACK4VZ_15635 [Paracoccaceae bacterium]